jgi:nucleoside-diphosphate-sugar epimerase
MNILVTGSNGFVGSRLMYELEAQSHQVIGIDISSHCDDQMHPNTLMGDVRKLIDLNKVQTKQSQIDLIIHCAAAKHDFGVSEAEYYSHNETGTQVVLDFANQQNINKIIYFSTVAVFGHPAKRTDEDGVYAPDHPYGASKLAGELLCLEWQKANPLAELIVLRPTVIYGACNYANMYKMLDMMHRRPYLTIGDGNYIKSIVSRANIIDMTIFSLSKLAIGVKIYNCVDKPYITVNKLMQIIAQNPSFRIPALQIPVSMAILIGKCFDLPAKLLKIDLPVNSDRMKKFATATDFASEKIRAEGYVQRFSIEEEMGKMTAWYMSLRK